MFMKKEQKKQVRIIQYLQPKENK